MLRVQLVLNLNAFTSYSRNRKVHLLEDEFSAPRPFDFNFNARRLEWRSSRPGEFKWG